MRIQPEGGVQEVGCKTICEAVGNPDAVSDEMIVSVGVSLVAVAICGMVAAGVGKLCGNVGGTCVGVAGAGRFSARERNIPPMTKITEKMAMITPPPNWRQACIISSTGSLQMNFWQSAA